MNRGDVVLVRFPHPSGVRGKKRPAVIVQHKNTPELGSSHLRHGLAHTDTAASGDRFSHG